MIIYRMVIVEGICDQLTSSSLHTYIIIGWHKSIVSSDWSDTMVWFGQILLLLYFTILYIWSLVGMERIGQWWLSVWLYHLQYHVSSDESTTELGSLISSVNIIISASSDHINTLAPHISLCICIQSTTVMIAFAMSIFIFIRNINDPRKYSTDICVCLQSKLQIWWFYLFDKPWFNSDEHIRK